METISDIDKDAITTEHNLESKKTKKEYKVQESQILSDIPKFLNHIKPFFPRFKIQRHTGRVYFRINPLYQISFADMQLILKEEMQYE